MSRKISGMQLGMRWHLDDWPDEIHVSHEMTPTAARSYIPKDSVKDLEDLARDLWYSCRCGAACVHYYRDGCRANFNGDGCLMLERINALGLM